MGATRLVLRIQNTSKARLTANLRFGLSSSVSAVLSHWHARVRALLRLCRSGGDIFANGLKLDLTKRSKILTSTISCQANVGEHGDVGWGHISYSIPTDEHERIHTALGMDECGVVQ